MRHQQSFLNEKHIEYNNVIYIVTANGVVGDDMTIEDIEIEGVYLVNKIDKSEIECTELMQDDDNFIEVLADEMTYHIQPIEYDHHDSD